MLYVTVVVVWPGETIEISPPQVHKHVHVLVSISIFPSVTVAEPGIQGSAVAGMHGMGVSTPIAAVVAVKTTGLASDMQVANGMMFTKGLLSMMFAAICSPHWTILIGKTCNTEGADPITHDSSAVITVA